MGLQLTKQTSLARGRRRANWEPVSSASMSLIQESNIPVNILVLHFETWQSSTRCSVQSLHPVQQLSLGTTDHSLHRHQWNTLYFIIYLFPPKFLIICSSHIPLCYSFAVTFCSLWAQAVKEDRVDNASTPNRLDGRQLSSTDQGLSSVPLTKLKPGLLGEDICFLCECCFWLKNALLVLASVIHYDKQWYTCVIMATRKHGRSSESVFGEREKGKGSGLWRWNFFYWCVVICFQNFPWAIWKHCDNILRKKEGGSMRACRWVWLCHGCWQFTFISCHLHRLLVILWEALSSPVHN